MKAERKENLFKGAYFVAGVLLYALVLDVFFVRNQIAAGGFSGIATIINSIVPIPVGTFVFLLNLPLLAVAAKLKGKNYALLTLASAFIYSALVDALAFLPSATDNKFVAAIFGGIIYGAASACLVKAKMSTGGSDLLAKILLVKFKNISLGKMYLSIDGLVVIAAIWAYRDLEAGLYAITAIYTCAIVTDKLIHGFNNAYICTIITSLAPEVIANPIMETMKGGVTCYYGVGMYEKKQKNVLVVVVRPHELSKLKQIVLQGDVNSFMVVGNASEVVGGGFENLNEINTSTLKYQQEIENARLASKRAKEEE